MKERHFSPYAAFFLLVHSLTELDFSGTGGYPGTGRRGFHSPIQEASVYWGLGAVVSFTNEEMNYALKEEVKMKSQFRE